MSTGKGPETSFKNDVFLALTAVCRVLDDGDRLSVTTASDRLDGDPSAMVENAVEAFCEGNNERPWTLIGGCGDDSDGPVLICEECYNERDTESEAAQLL